jgi:iron complex outermembrane receptor protein
MLGPAPLRFAPCLSLVIWLFAAAPVAGQGSITGTVTDSATGAAVEGVRLQAIGADGRARGGTLSNERGHFRLGPLPAGPWTVTAARIGYAQFRRVGVAVPADAEVAFDFVLAVRPMPASEIIVTATRQPETTLQAPASTSVVTRQQVAQQITATPIDLLAGVTGMDVASKGLAQRTYTARGSRGASTGSFLTLVDGRDQTLPSIAFNIPYLVPASASDVDHIEVVRGPAGAVYGPNTERGVAQIITRSPFEAPGTTLSLSGGNRDLFQAEMRQAGLISSRIGYKLTGEFLGGTDWVYVDTTGNAKRDTAAMEGNPDTVLIGVRDPKVERYAVGGEFEWHAGGETALQTGMGYALAVSAVDLEPTLGPIQLVNWGFGNAEAQVSNKRLMGRVSYTWNNSGDSYSLWYGNRLVDLSSMLTAQLKASGALARGGSLQYGGDVRYTSPNTMGTIDGANEGDDQVTEVGAFVLSELPVGARVILSAALRADYHDRIGTVAVAPRVGIVYQPTATQAFRLTYGRGYTTPAPPDFFADVQLADNLGGLPYDVRISGIPPGGYQFRRDCAGLCMRSPFDPNPGAFQPIDATAYWANATAILQAEGGPDLSGIPAPTAAEVGSVLRELNLVTQAFNAQPVSQASIVDYPTESRETTDAIEAGYKAALGGRWNLGVDVAYSRTQNFFGASYVGTPNVFLDEAALTAYLTPYLGGDAATAAQVAAGMAQIPLGVVTPANATDPTALLQLRHQGGSFTRLGVDVEVSYLVSNALTVSGNYSWVNRDSIGSAGGSDMAVLSAPRNKGALAVSFRPLGNSWGVWAQGLAVETYPVKSGWFQGTIPGYAVLNAGVTTQLPSHPDLTVSLTATNIFNHLHQEYVGAPVIGRLLVGRIQAAY